jgi:hypothetical protein
MTNKKILSARGEFHTMLDIARANAASYGCVSSIDGAAGAAVIMWRLGLITSASFDRVLSLLKAYRARTEPPEWYC